MIKLLFASVVFVAILAFARVTTQSAVIEDAPTFQVLADLDEGGWPVRQSSSDVELSSLPDTIYVSIVNAYDVSLALLDSLAEQEMPTLTLLGLSNVVRTGDDRASGRITRDGDTYRGRLAARATGSMDTGSGLFKCADYSDGSQEIYAVAHIEPATGLALSPRGEVLHRGSLGEFDLTFYFFPETAPVFAVRPTCQSTIGFEGYTRNPYGNAAPYPWLPQERSSGEFVPFNDTKWTTQIGLRLHVPPAGGELEYEDERDHNPELGSVSTWSIYMSRGR
ncbi:MAG: hypothetical protein R3284_04375 [Rubricoccaceae bacterium]|nr:hypothetical protein [Rubricoccaceae bacterium]